jgi:O-antigen ligase
MNTRTRAFDVVTSTIVAGAAIVGVLAALQPLLAVGLVGGIVLAWVVFNDLATGFAILAFVSFLDTLPTSGALSLAKGAGLLIALAWLASFATDRRGEGDFFSDHALLTWVLVVFFGWASISLLWAPNFGVGLESLTRYAPNLLLLPIAYSAMRTRRDITLVVSAIVFGALVAAAFGILQPPDPELIAESSRATSTVGDPNELAAFMLVGLALGAAVAVGRGRAPGIRLAGALAVPMCAATVFLSLSRGGLIALGVMMVAGTVFAGRWRVVLTAMVILVAASGVLYFTAIASLPARERVTSSNGGTGRSDIWKLGLRMVRAHPIQGVGVGQFPEVSADYALQPGSLERVDLVFSTAPKVTHNTYLEIMSEDGIPGFLLFMALVTTCLFASLKAARVWAARGDPTMEALARGAFLGLLGMLVADFFISEMYSKLLWVMLAIGPALLAVARADAAAAERADEARGSTRPQPRGGASSEPWPVY